MAKQVSISSRKMIRDSDIISALISGTTTTGTTPGGGGTTQNLQSVLSTGNQTTLAIDMRNATDDSVLLYTDTDGNLRIEGSLVVEGEVQAWTVGNVLPATVWDSLGNHVDGTTIEYTNNTLTSIGGGGALDRVKWLNTWSIREYLQNDMVLDGEWTMIANKTTEDRAAPQPTGDPWWVFEDSLIEASAVAKQVIVGNRYTFPRAGYLNNIRIWTVIGEHYDVFMVLDPTGPSPIFNQLVQFTATIDGWSVINVSSSLLDVNAIFDVVTIVTEGDPVTTNTILSYSYQNPNNPIDPGQAIINHANTETNILRISKTDFTADQSAFLSTLSIGDTITGAGVVWTIQNILEKTSSFDFNVEPRVQGSPTGQQDFIFGVVTAATIKYDWNQDYWSTNNLSANGLIAVDTAYADITVNDSAYGVDIEVQEVSISDDWDVVSHSASVVGSGGGGDSIWGQIAGTLSNQIDLQTELNGKENIFSKNTGFNKNLGTSANTISEGNHSHTGVYEPIFNKNTGFNKNYGTTSTTVAQGNHLHSIYEPIFNKNSGFNKNFGTSALTVSEGNHDHNTAYLGINSNAISATKWNTARTFDIIGDVTGNGVSFDGTANLTFTAIVGNDTHTHDTRYFTESESNSRFVNITGDTMTGDLSVTGNITATSDITAFSDVRLKDNIRDLESISDKFKSLRPIRYTTKTNIEKIGLIAQEVDKLFPEFVIKGDQYMSLDYMKMITLCISEIQKLNNKLDAITNN